MKHNKLNLIEGGMSYFCILIDHSVIEKLKINNKVIGPLEGENFVKYKIYNFKFGFVKDPSGFPVFI